MAMVETSARGPRNRRLLQKEKCLGQFPISTSIRYSRYTQRRRSTMIIFRFEKALAPRLLNLGLRALTMICRLFLLLLLARLIEPGELGLFGLVAATIAFSLYFLGFDFYVHTARELVRHPQADWGGLVKSQIALTGLTYLLATPILVFLFAEKVLPLFLAPWLAVLMVLEHVNQELSRLFIAIGSPIVASLILFLRSGVWVLPLGILLLLNAEGLRLETVFLYWTFGGLLGAGFGAICLYRLELGGWSKRIDWHWIFRGLRIAIPFLAGTLCLRAIFTLDRYMFEAYLGLETLAAYVLFVGIAATLNSFLEAGVFAFLYPALVKHWGSKSAEAFRYTGRALLSQVVTVCIVFSAFALLILPFLLSWLDNEIYTDSKDLFYWLLIAMMLFVLSMIPHYSLYAQGLDKFIQLGHFLSLAVFVVTVLIVGAFDKFLSVPIALCVTFFMLLVVKSVACMLLTPPDYKWFSNK